MLRTAIVVKYLPPSSHRPARFKASTMSARPTSVIVSPGFVQSDNERYSVALSALLGRMGDGWGNASEWIAGATDSGRVYVRSTQAVR